MREPPEFEGSHDYADLALQFDRRLVIPVRARLEYGDRSTTELVAKLDTGAEVCFFGPAWARQLEIQLGGAGAQRAATATGRFSYYPARVRLVLPGWRVGGVDVAYDVDVHFADWDDPDYQDRAVLGVLGFLDRFSIGLQDSVQRLWWGRDCQQWPR